MINEKVYDLLNKQVNFEIASAYVYLEISNFFVDKGLDGFAHWFKLQAGEEMEHAEKIMEYIQDNDLKVVLEAIPAPNNSYEDPIDAANMFLSHELEVTAAIHNIYEAALEEKDYRSRQFLDWFVEEQNEEEANAHDMIGKLEYVGNKGPGLLALDGRFGRRE